MAHKSVAISLGRGHVEEPTSNKNNNNNQKKTTNEKAEEEKNNLLTHILPFPTPFSIAIYPYSQAGAFSLP